MFFSDIIILRSETAAVDSDGYPAPTTSDVTVWANKKSVSRSEFYSANANGIDVTIAFEVHAEDYGNQTQVVDGSKVYDVVRAYRKGEGIVELNCKDKAV